MAEKRKMGPTREESSRMSRRGLFNAAGREHRKLTAREKRLVELLNLMRERFGEDEIQRMAANPSPDYDGIRGALELERKRIERRIRN